MFYNPPAINDCTMSRPDATYLCAVCWHRRNNDGFGCFMNIGLWAYERYLGKVCLVCQCQLHEAEAVTIGSLTGEVFVRPDYLLRLCDLYTRIRWGEEFNAWIALELSGELQ